MNREFLFFRSGNTCLAPGYVVRPPEQQRNSWQTLCVMAVCFLAAPLLLEAVDKIMLSEPPVFFLEVCQIPFTANYQRLI
jgi:hypothetical protein